ncbi:MAG: hypothetical protein IJJ26_12760, partial [Victivallales bacterium]|nr:hypothetical protein [Victivallales bacterium]
LFFATPADTWNDSYRAQHLGSLNDWTGTGETVSAAGKGRIQNLFFGSTDANVLCLTDSDNGDALFFDDIFTAFPEEVDQHIARLGNIQEIRAGVGDDIVDLTSQRYLYVGEGLSISGGDGNDVIWANKGDNTLFGDMGNDRLVGASGDDILVGGAGNDRMHGGGGNDIFAFGGNWGNDTVGQLASGTITLWFDQGQKDNWNEITRTYTDGDNSVKVLGTATVNLAFGDEDERYDNLLNTGAFSEALCTRIFEQNDAWPVITG